MATGASVPHSGSLGPAPTVVFHRRRLSLWMHVVFWTALGVFGLAMAIYTCWFAADMEPYARHISLGLALILAAVSANYAAFAGRELRADGPAIVIGPDGLHDRRISDRPIPWLAVTRVRVFRVRGEVVMFEVTRGEDAALGIYQGPRLKSCVNRALGLPGYDLIQLGNDASPNRLAAAIRPFMPVDGA